MVVAQVSFTVCLIGFGLIGVGLAAVFPLGCIRAANDPEVTAGQGLAGVATLGYGGIMLGPSIIGFVSHQYSLTAGFGVVLVCCLYIGLFSGALSPRTEAHTT